MKLTTSTLNRFAQDLYFENLARRSLNNDDRCVEANRGTPIIVSLTTFPARFKSAELTIKTLLRQSVKADAIVVNLAVEENEAPLPLAFQELRQRGVRFEMQSSNMKSYSKLLPTLIAYPRGIIITADDDVLYPPDWLAQLLVAHHERPNTILGHRGTIILGGQADLAPYTSWPRADTATPSQRLFLTGNGGILYPPKSLPSVTHDLALIDTLCKSADDIWFKAMQLMSGTPAAKLSASSGDFPIVRRAQEFSLRKTNVEDRANDRMFKDVFNHFNIWSKLQAPFEEHHKGDPIENYSSN